jgi:hypothetical protein
MVAMGTDELQPRSPQTHRPFNDQLGAIFSDPQTTLSSGVDNASKKPNCTTPFCRPTPVFSLKSPIYPRICISVL